MRIVRPGLVVFALSLLASLSVHLPVYTVLGALARTLLHDAPASPRAPIELEIASLPDAPAAPARPSPAAPDRLRPSAPPAPAQQPIAPRDEPAVAPPTLQPQPPAASVSLPAPPRAPEAPNKLAVTQKSEDPSVPPPDDARFLAEENRRVEQETVASVTNLQEDSEQTQPGAELRVEASADEGNAATERLADLQDARGEQVRAPTPAEARQPAQAEAQLGEGSRSQDAIAAAPVAGGSDAEQAPQREIAAGAAAVGGEQQALVIDDGIGQIRVRRALPGTGPGAASGARTLGADAARPAREGMSAARPGTNLKLGWAQFESTFGSEQLRAQRDAFVAQRKSLARGSSRDREWKKFRSAIENFVPNVRPGNQTALNAAASPFAQYLAEAHRRIHREFAMRFLSDVGVLSGPYSDYSLFTKLEIIINRDGTLHRVGVVQTSGFLPFDYGAWNAVLRAAPYPEAPAKILSGDGRVYVRWGFYRNERQCGTFNAEPYILPSPPGMPAPSTPPMRDRGEEDGKLGERRRRIAPALAWTPR